MEVKFTKEQEELLLKNYNKACSRAKDLRPLDKALGKVFLLECINDMLSSEVSDKIHSDLSKDTALGTMEFLLK